MVKRIVTLLFLSCLVVVAVITVGCGKKEEGDTQKTSASINNNDPRAASAPGAEMGESPGQLAARMGGNKGGITKKLGAGPSGP